MRQHVDIIVTAVLAVVVGAAMSWAALPRKPQRREAAITYSSDRARSFSSTTSRTARSRASC